jgi:hypothetical protein
VLAALLVLVAGFPEKAAGSRPSAGGAARELLLVGQFEFPPQLVVRGDRVEVGYDAQYSLHAQEIPNATGTLYVRNDGQRGFTAVPLRISKASGSFPSPYANQRKLRALVPKRLLEGRRLFYYAVIRDRRSGGVVTVPAYGARAPESVWIVNDAFRVNLGTYVFGQLRAPEAVVAHAGPGEIGFNACPPGEDCGIQSGPWSFEIAKDGSIWLLDQENDRLLVWEPGYPDAVARTMPLPPASPPPFAFGDFALGPAGSVYLVRRYSEGLPLHPGTFPPQDHFPPLRLSRVSERGAVLWTGKLDTDIANTQLRTGRGGTLWVGAWSATWKDMNGWHAWAPAATVTGRPLSLAEQERLIRWALPLAGGRQLVLVSAGWTGLPWTPEPHEQRVALVDRTGRVVRAWRIRSRTSIEPPFPSVTPALVGGDPVVVLFPTRVQGGAFQREYLVLRLGRQGGVRAQFALPFSEPPLSAFGEWAITGIRIQPGGNIYQLGSAPDFGAAIYRYSLDPS